MKVILLITLGTFPLSVPLFLFPIKNLFKLRKISEKVTYNVAKLQIKIIPKSSEREDNINNLFGILSKQSKETVKYP